MEVRYEDLVEDPEPLLRRVADFVDLPWDAGMLEYHHRAEERMRDVVRDFHPLGSRPGLRDVGGRVTATAGSVNPQRRPPPPDSGR
jgi:hypothetical protein